MKTQLNKSLIEPLLLFTSVIEGGILQFSVRILEILLKHGIKTRLMIPRDSKATIDDRIKEYVILFDKSKNILLNKKQNKQAAKFIYQFNPRIIWYMDNCIVTSQIANIVSNLKVRQIVTVHDPLPHPSYTRKSIKSILHSFVSNFYGKRLEKQSTIVLTLSEQSKKDYARLHQNYESKVRYLNLGSHAPSVDEKEPNEVFGERDYILFFGRIDKYKGLGAFLDVIDEFDFKRFVIAGSGTLTEYEIKKIRSNSRITLINSYIPDEEMVYLFKNAKCLVLPYIEASQSGIIPIAYYFKKPVIVSNVKGLAQFVKEDSTGYICENKNDYLEALKSVFSDKYDELSKNAFDYYLKYLDFDRNIMTFLENEFC